MASKLTDKEDDFSRNLNFVLFFGTFWEALQQLTNDLLESDLSFSSEDKKLLNELKKLTNRSLPSAPVNQSMISVFKDKIFSDRTLAIAFLGQKLASTRVGQQQEFGNRLAMLADDLYAFADRIFCLEEEWLDEPLEV